MATKHTPGPWDVDGDGPFIECPGIEAPELNFSVVMFGANDDDAGVRGRTPAEAVANARLMAAAPELLDELTKAGEIIKAMLNAMTDSAKHAVALVLEQRGISPDGMTRAHERDAVIRKATGLE